MKGRARTQNEEDVFVARSWPTGEARRSTQPSKTLKSTKGRNLPRSRAWHTAFMAVGAITWPSQVVAAASAKKVRTRRTRQNRLVFVSHCRPISDLRRPTLTTKRSYYT